MSNFAPMKLTAHLGKITWSLADKGLYVLYGLVQLLQIKALPADAYGVFAILVALNTWIMIVSDGSALAGLVQFGTKKEDRPRVNTMGLVIHVALVGIAALLIYLIRDPLSMAFAEPRFVVVATMLPLYALLTLPRMFCLRLLYRDFRMRDLFIVDMVWFGVRTGMTIWALSNDQLNTLEDIIRIDFVGMAASSIAIMWLTRKELKFSWKGNISVGQYLRYGLPLAVATALNSTLRQLDVLIVAAFFGVGVVGVYNPAKNLFRFFEQAFDAVVVLLYPAAVRMYSEHRTEDLQILITKAISITLLPTILALIVLELGASNIIVTILGEQYADSVVHFNVLILGALGLPFWLMGSVIAAMGKSTVVVRFSAVGLIFGMATLLGVSYAGWSSAIGLGMVVNTVVFGVLSTRYVRKTIHFPTSAFFPAFHDIRNAISNRMKTS